MTINDRKQKKFMRFILIILSFLISKVTIASMIDTNNEYCPINTIKILSTN